MGQEESQIKSQLHDRCGKVNGDNLEPKSPMGAIWCLTGAACFPGPLASVLCMERPAESVAGTGATDHAPCGRRSEHHVLEAAESMPCAPRVCSVMCVPTAHLPEENLKSRMVVRRATAPLSTNGLRAPAGPPPRSSSTNFKPRPPMKRVSRHMSVQGLHDRKGVWQWRDLEL